MDAGDFNKRLRIERPVEAPNGAGQLIVQWDDGGVIYAHIRPKSAKEAQGPQRVEEVGTHVITVRYNPITALIDAKWRLIGSELHRERTRVFEIVSATNVREENVELELICNETK